MTGTPPGNGAGYVTITAPFTGESVILLLDQQPPTPSGFVGGWDTVPIPRKRPVRYFATAPEGKLELAVIVEKRPEASVTRQIRTLYSIGIAAVEQARRPRQVEVAGQLPPLPIDRWVIDDVTWGDAKYTDQLHIVEQRLTLTLGEPPTVDAVDVSRGGRSRYRSSTGKRQRVRYARIRPGETLQEFAARTLGNPSRWKEIAKLQKPPITDPRRVKDGRKLRLP